jgi:transcriptional regulator with XRE-family HTH domain
MNVPSLQFLTGAALLSKAMRAIRRKRGLRTSDIAKRMGMAQRSYEHFESGRGRVSYERILAFAEATDSDPFALMATLALDSPEFPVRTADNKLVLIWMLTLRDLNEELGEDIAYLEAKTVIGALTRVSRELVEHVRKRDTFAETWLSERLGAPTTNIRKKNAER